MMVISQAPNGAVSGRRLPSSPSSSNPNSPPLFPKPKSAPRLLPARRLRNHPLCFSAAPPSGAGPTTSSAPVSGGEAAPVMVGVGEDGVPLEGVIRFEKAGGGPESKLISSAKVGLLAGGDVLCLLVFSGIGRFSHGMPALDVETWKTADPFIAGWLLSAYFLGAFGDDGKGENGTGSAVTAAAKSWAVGIPLGIAIRAVTSGHIPPAAFILVTMGSTGILLIAWRALASKLLSGGQSKQNDDYKRGSPFELFELLTSLVRRW